MVKSNSHRLIKHREFLILTDLGDLERNEESLLINDAVEDIETLIGKLSFDTVEGLFEVSKNTIFVDKDLLKFPLEFRLWKEGDVFQPSGMTGKKKLSKYLKDEKQSLVEKENTWLLTSDNKVVWVVGKRADERFKVTNNTKNRLKVEIQ
nr:tRNA lysidine(34) synthetase TilS [Winogradskyella pacifica]